jgi:hypothetical protein
MLALFKRPNRLDVSFFLPGNGNKCTYRNIAFSSFFLQFFTMSKVHKASESELASTYIAFKVYNRVTEKLTLFQQLTVA